MIGKLLAYTPTQGLQQQLRRELTANDVAMLTWVTTRRKTVNKLCLK